MKITIHPLSVLVGAALLFLLPTPGAAQCDSDRLVADDLPAFPCLYCMRATPGFGGRVAAHEDRVVVANPRDSSFTYRNGAVYVFERSGLNWFQIQKLFPSDPKRETLFGGCDTAYRLNYGLHSAGDTAIWGNTIVVGTPLAVNRLHGKDEGDDKGTGLFRTGALYVFELIGSTWIETARLTGESPVEGPGFHPFGVHVDIEEDTILVGALWHSAYDGPTTHVFERRGGDWVETQLLPGSGRIHLAGNWAAVGRSVFERIDGVWVEADVLPGEICAFDGDTAVVGTPWRVDAYEKIGEDWVHEGELFSAYWGSAISAAALEGDTVLVGQDMHAYCDWWGDPGKVHVFEREDGFWSASGVLPRYDALSCDCFGRSVATNGDLVLVGAGAEIDRGGAVYAMSLSGTDCGSLAIEKGIPGGTDASIDLGYGGELISTLTPGVELAGRPYWLLGTTSGTSPGLTVGEYRIPLNVDLYTWDTLVHPNSGFFTNNFGLLDGSGSAVVTLTIPPGTSLPHPQVVHHAFLVFDGGWQIAHVSNASHLLLRD